MGCHQSVTNCFIGAQKKPIAKRKAVVPCREEISLKSLNKSKQYSQNDEPQATASSKSVKSKGKSKGTKTGLKDMGFTDDVYAPGFRLRSKKTEVVEPKPNRILKEVKYSGMEPKVKLPWPVSIILPEFDLS